MLYKIIEIGYQRSCINTWDSQYTSQAEDNKNHKSKEQLVAKFFNFENVYNRIICHQSHRPQYLLI